MYTPAIIHVYTYVGVSSCMYIHVLLPCVFNCSGGTVVTPRLHMRRAGLSNRVRLSVCLCVCLSTIEMCPKCTIYGFSCLQRACGQRKSYLLYVHNASGSIRLYSLPFRPLHIYRIYREPLTRSSYYVTTYGTQRVCACAYEINTAG